MFRSLAAGVCAAALTVSAGFAQAPSSQPQPIAPQPVAQTGLPQAVEQTALAKDAFSTGLISRGEGALAPDLWRGADADRLGALLALAPTQLAGPALGEAMRRVLLSPGDAPEGADASLGGRKLLALARAGFIDEAQTIASLSSTPKSDPWVGQALAVADLLNGAVNAACARNASLSSRRDADFWMKLRLVCYAAAGERDAADLTLTVLRESGVFNRADDVLLTALATGVSPRTAIGPSDAIELAAVRQIGQPLTPKLLSDADAGVLKAIARDPSFDAATRIAAANGAAAMGVVNDGDLAAFYESFDVDVVEIGRAAELLRESPNDPMTDVIVYQAVRQMTAPEFLRDKAVRIADALAAADSFARMNALSHLYAGEIDEMEGALLTPREAAAFAAARMTIGDGDGAARWLFAMLGTGGSLSLEENEVIEMIELTNFLSVLDPISAAAVAEAANVAVADPRERRAAAGDDGFAARRRQIVAAAFDAAIEDIPGQAALAALAMSGVSGPDDAVGEVIIDQSLRAAGLNELRPRIAFEAAWRARYDAAREASSQGETEASAGAQSPAAGEDEGLTPRVKPRSSG